MSIDYNQLKILVKEALGGDAPGGFVGASAPADVPHRMPAADPTPEEGDPKANKMYDIALAAREATEKLVEALDDPTFDDAYEFAFKASAALRRVLNSLETSGAEPTPEQRVVAPPADQQKYGSDVSYRPSAAASGGTAFGIHPQSGAALSDIAEAAGEEQLVGSRFGQGALSKGAHAAAIKAKGTQLAQGDALGGVDQKERKMLQDLENILTTVADQDNLLKFRPMTIEYLKKVQALMKGAQGEK